MSDITVGAHIFEEVTMQDLSFGPLNHTTGFNTDFRLNYISFHLTTPVTQDFKVIIDALAGAEFDAEIFKGKIQNMTSFLYVPEESFVLKKGNELKVWMENNGAPASIVNVVIRGVQE